MNYQIKTFLARKRLNNVLTLLYKGRQNIKHSRNCLRDELDEIHSMHRSKKVYIPIVGKALSFLFGTLSELMLAIECILKLCKVLD